MVDSAMARSAADKEVWVTKGTYRTIGLTAVGALRGGFLASDNDTSREWQRNLSTLRGNGGQVVILRASALVECFVLSGGYSPDGAVEAHDGSTLRHCVTTDNSGGDTPDLAFTDAFTMQGCACIGLLRKYSGDDSRPPSVIENSILITGVLTGNDSLAFVNTIVQGLDLDYANSVSMTNCIVARTHGGDVNATHCCYSDSGVYRHYAAAGPIPGAVVGAPGFVSTSSTSDTAWFTDASYYLLNTSTSPCYQAGLSSAAPATDIRGRPRTAPVDIGPYEQ